MDHACARTCVRRLVYGRHISARDAQFMSVCDRSKKSSGKTSVEGKNGRIDFSSLVWDKGIAKTHDVCSAPRTVKYNVTLHLEQVPNFLLSNSHTRIQQHSIWSFKVNSCRPCHYNLRV